MKTTLGEVLLMVPGHIDILLSDNGDVSECDIRGSAAELMHYLSNEVLEANVLDIYPKFADKVLWIIVNMWEDEDYAEL